MARDDNIASMRPFEPEPGPGKRDLPGAGGLPFGHRTGQPGRGGQAFEDVVIPTAAGRLLLLAVVGLLAGYGFVFAMQGALLPAAVQRAALGMVFALRFVASGLTRVVIVVHARGEGFQKARAVWDRRRWVGEVLIILGGVSLVFEMMYPHSQVLRMSLFLGAVLGIGLGVDVKAKARDWFMARCRIVGQG